MIKAYLILSIVVIWVDALLSALLHIRLSPFTIDNIGIAYSSWAFVLMLLGIYVLRANVNFVASPQERWREDDEFLQFSREVESRYKDRREALKFKTFMLAFSGYLVIFALVGFLFAIAYVASNVVNKYFHIGYYAYAWYAPATLVACIIIYKLFSPKGGYYGLQVNRRQAPRLFSFLKKIRERGRGPAFDKVFIDMELNAAVSRNTGILGAFGFGPVVLNIGLPLMQVLTVNQLAGVIAHEYGHVAAKDNPLAQWIYRIRDTWLEASGTFNKDKLWVLFFGRLHKKFIAKFKAYSFALARFCEYDADAFAAKATGGINIAEALAVISYYSDRINQFFWQDIWRRAQSSPHPSVSPYSQMREYIEAIEFSENDLEKILKEQGDPDPQSTHPDLAERLENLSHNIYELRERDIDAATALLGEAMEKNLAFLFDRVWREYSDDKWNKVYQSYQEAVATLTALNAKRYSSLDIDDLCDIIYAAKVAEDDQSIINACREILVRDVDNLFAKVNLYGYSLVYEGREENLLLLDDLVREQPSVLPFACYFAIKHLEKVGRLEEAKIYHFRLEDWEYKKEAAEEERNYIYANDILQYHGMHQQHIKVILGILCEHKEISKAWLVRKEIGYFKDTPFFPLVLKKSAFSLGSRKRILHEVQTSLEKQGLAKYTRAFWLDEYKGLKKKIRKLPEAMIYKK